MTRTLIIGTGDMAYALCHLFKNHNYKPDENCLAVSKPGLNHQFLKSIPGFHDTGVPLVQLEDAIAISDIIILAVPASALKGLLGKHFAAMKNKILVDVTNSSVRGEDLHGMLGLTGARWVKAFNDNGAVDILLDKPFSKKSMVTNICGRSMDAVDKVKSFAEEALGFSAKIVPVDQYQEIAMNQDSFGDDWVHATYIILVLFVLTELYAILRYNVFKGYAWYHLPIQVTNKAICWTALNGFALTMLPGLLARMYDAFHYSKMLDKPKLIRFGLKVRKALGLLALWFLGIHIFMSLLIFNPKYYSKFFAEPKAPSSKLNAIGESSFFFAILGTGFYAILGFCSLPSVGPQMTSRSWKLVYGELAWAALLFGTVHVLIMGVEGWDDLEKWPGRMPPITLTSTLIPMLVMFLKLVQMAAKLFVGSSFESDSTSVANDFVGKRSEHAGMLDEEQSSALIRVGPSVTSRNGNVTPDLPASLTDVASGDQEMPQPSTSFRAKFKEFPSNDSTKGPF